MEAYGKSNTEIEQALEADTRPTWIETWMEECARKAKQVGYPDGMPVSPWPVQVCWCTPEQEKKIRDSHHSGWEFEFHRDGGI